MEPFIPIFLLASPSFPLGPSPIVPCYDVMSECADQVALAAVHAYGRGRGRRRLVWPMIIFKTYLQVNSNLSPKFGWARAVARFHASPSPRMHDTRSEHRAGGQACIIKSRRRRDDLYRLGGRLAPTSRWSFSALLSSPPQHASSSIHYSVFGAVAARTWAVKRQLECGQGAGGHSRVRQASE